MLFYFVWIVNIAKFFDSKFLDHVMQVKHRRGENVENFLFLSIVLFLQSRDSIVTTVSIGLPSWLYLGKYQNVYASMCLRKVNLDTL